MRTLAAIAVVMAMAGCASGAAKYLIAKQEASVSDNAAPILAAIADKAVNEAASLTFTATATDTDTWNTLTFTGTDLPTGAAIDTAGNFNWIPTYSQSGVYEITITVTDNGTPALSDFEQVIITVSNVEEPVAGTYYVDPVNGLDTNDGSTAEEAWKTLTKVGTSSVAGDHIYIVNGDTTIFYPYSNNGATAYVEWPDRYYFSDRLIQWGITVYLNSEYERIGRFVNGDYWVVGPFSVSAYTPASSTIDGKCTNGIMVDCDTEGQGFDQRASGFSATLDVNDELPYLISGQSLPLSILVSTSNTVKVGYSYVSTVMVFTALSQAISNNTYFRPGYRKYTGQVLEYQWSDVNTADLGAVALACPKALLQVDGQAQSGSLERRVERPWVETVRSFTGEYSRPSLNMEDYGRDIMSQSGMVALALHDSQWSIAQKTCLLKRYIQIGIDYGSIFRDANDDLTARDFFRETGGHPYGRYWPILFAGIMLNDPNLYNIGTIAHQDSETGTIGAPNYIYFGENDNTCVVLSTDVCSPPYPITSWTTLRDNTGTVSVTKGSTLVTGLVGDNWAGVLAGDNFVSATDEVRLIAWDAVPYVVASVNSGVSPPTITLTQAYEGETNGAAAFCLAYRVYVGSQYDSLSNSRKDLKEFTAEWIGRGWYFDAALNGRRSLTDPTGLTYAYQNMVMPKFGYFALSAAIMEANTSAMTLWNSTSFFEAVDEMYERQTDDFEEAWVETAMHSFWDTYYAP